MYSAYEQILYSYMKAPIVMLIVGFAVLLALCVFAIKFQFFKEIRILLLAGIVVLIAGYFLGVYPYQRDITTQAYEKYTGEFYVEEYYFATNSGVNMRIQFPGDDKSSRFRAPGNLENIEDDTTYQGVVVYGKNSKAIVEIVLEEP